MNTSRLFSPSEAARITGVSPEVALAWRRRGVWGAAEEGRHVRYDLKALCALKLIRTIIEAGIPAGTAAEYAADHLVDPMVNAVLAQTRPHLSIGFGLIMRRGQDFRVLFAWDLGGLVGFGGEEAPPWHTLIIINLGDLAKEMVAFGVMD